MVSHWDPTQKRVIHRSINACLAPLASVEGMHVITVEGIGNMKTGLHPVQVKIVVLLLFIIFVLISLFLLLLLLFYYLLIILF